MTRQDYRSEIRSLVQQVWAGSLTPGQAIGQMRDAIDRNLNAAWAAGARECGVLPGEYTIEEQLSLESALNQQIAYISRFIRHVARNGEADGYDIAKHFSRLELWEQRWQHFRQRGKQMACADRKARWVLGPTEHCRDCLRASGRVYRMSIWTKYGYRPGAHALACRGFRCACSFELTDDPVTPGRPPSIRGAR